jgi:2-polyprenyl-3-methyl-5-hydroxy-6-metoxy-1,4-benzoquinol methylase
VDHGPRVDADRFFRERGDEVGLLSSAANAAYWESRHQEHGDLRSGGHVSYDESTNRMFYLRRLSLLQQIIGNRADPGAPLFLLDAGCGKGWFSRELAAFGHQVDGIDGSDVAITLCQQTGGGPRYARSTLSAWRSPWLYDAVVCVDVLFHILDEDEWERSVRNLASLVRLTGRLVVADWGQDHDHVYGDYMVARGRQRYVRLLDDCGLRSDGWHPYRFRQSPIGFHAFTRTR